MIWMMSLRTKNHWVLILIMILMILLFEIKSDIELDMEEISVEDDNDSMGDDGPISVHMDNLHGDLNDDPSDHAPPISYPDAFSLLSSDRPNDPENDTDIDMGPHFIHPVPIADLTAQVDEEDMEEETEEEIMDEEDDYEDD